jgi:hypothetical protein
MYLWLVQKEEEEKAVVYTDPGYPNTYFANPVMGW